MAEPDSGCGGAGELQDGSQELLSRYIFSLRDRVTTRSHAVKPDKQPRLSMKSISNHSKTAFDQLSTSDYSSSSSHDRGAELVTPPSLSPSAGSPASRPGSSLHCTETDVGWDSEGGEGGMVWESQAEYEHFCAELKTQKGLLVELGGVRLLAPPSSSSPPSLQMEPSPPRSAWPTLPASRAETLCCVPVSPAVTVKAGQSTTFPRAALLMVPLDCEVDQPDLVSCLYREPGQPAWQPLPHHCATARCQADTILLTIRYTGSFLVVYEEPAPTITKKIRRRIGGRLKMSQYAENLEVKFPRGSCQEDIVASLKILGNLQLPSAGGVLDTDQPLACPVIMLEPHGVKFNQTSDTPVEIQLPVPDYDRIQQLQPRPELLFYHAAHSGPTKLLRWERMELAFTRISRYRKKGAPDRVYVTFPVTHFSFFKVVWDTLSSSLYGAKLGFSYLAPNWVTFPMKCRAYMEENKDNNTFGLEVVCYNIENNPEQTQNSNYKYLVGSSSKPRLVKPGSVKIKLNSQKFRPDTDAGEDDVMEKFEEDFRGRDFAKEFACIFKETSKVDQGTFGKVQVQRIDSTDKQKIENLFEFNLKKSGNETEKVTTMESDQWSCMAIKELAGNLNLHDDKNWRMFAKYIGFTKWVAILGKCQLLDDYFQCRGGQHPVSGGTVHSFDDEVQGAGRFCPGVPAEHVRGVAGQQFVCGCGRERGLAPQPRLLLQRGVGQRQPGQPHQPPPGRQPRQAVLFLRVAELAARGGGQRQWDGGPPHGQQPGRQAAPRLPRRRQGIARQEALRQR